MVNPLSVGLIGCGNFARWQHLPNLMRLPEASLDMVCDRDLSLAQECARRFGGRPCADGEALLADPSIAVVVIALRDELQAAWCCKALAAGKHVYVEKPVGCSAAEIASVARCAAEHQRQVAVGFQKRFAPAYVLAKEILLRHGNPAGGHNISLRMCDDAWRWATGYAPGALIAHDLCHLFDLARWLCQAPVVDVYARRSRPDDDALLMTMGDGSTVSIIASGHGSMDMPKERLEIVSGRGGIWVEDFCELRSYGYPEAVTRQCFAGAVHPELPLLSSHLLAEQGAAGLASIRRIAWSLRSQSQQGAWDGHPDQERVAAFVTQTIPNFLRDQGWYAAMGSFLRSLASDQAQAFPGARIDDAAHAAAVAAAALRSLDSGRAEQPTMGEES